MNNNRVPPVIGPVGTALPCQTIPPQRILVAEDDRDIRHFSSEMLVRTGYEVNAAEDGAAAWEALQAGSYDLLITGHNMPKVTGLALLKGMRAARMSTPVILATGALPSGELEWHPWLQPATMLRKPYTVVEFLKTVKEILQYA